VREPARPELYPDDLFTLRGMHDASLSIGWRLHRLCNYRGRYRGEETSEEFVEMTVEAFGSRRDSTDTLAARRGQKALLESFEGHP
jgi:hypothetical protein